jgi:hypothetical protein
MDGAKFKKKHLPLEHLQGSLPNYVPKLSAFVQFGDALFAVLAGSVPSPNSATKNLSSG